MFAGDPTGGVLGLQEKGKENNGNKHTRQKCFHGFKNKKRQPWIVLGLSSLCFMFCWITCMVGSDQMGTLILAQTEAWIACLPLPKDWILAMHGAQKVSGHPYSAQESTEMRSFHQRGRDKEVSLSQLISSLFDGVGRLLLGDFTGLLMCWPGYSSWGLMLVKGVI